MVRIRPGLFLNGCVKVMNEFGVSIEGMKQGKFKGEGFEPKFKDKIVGIAFGYEVQSPIDNASGQATGKRQHHPVWFVKEWGAASPQIFQALVTNEVLKSVIFEFYKKTVKGAEEIYFTIKLTNASISGLRLLKGNDGSTCQMPGASLAGSSKELDLVTLTFQRIDIESKTGKTTASDSWRI